MLGRRCRIAVSFASLSALITAIALTIWAVTSPQWQVAELGQINQFRYVGLYQTCALGNRQAIGQPMWVCTFIPYGQWYFRNQYSLIGGISDDLNPGTTVTEAYNAYGNDSLFAKLHVWAANTTILAWRLSTLVLLSMAIFFGFLSLVLEILEICLDATRTRMCLKAMSGLSLIALILATLCSLLGMLIFAVESQQNLNLYILELTAFAIFHLGESFYIGIAAMVTFLVALGLDISGAVLLYLTAKSAHSARRQLYYDADDYTEYKQENYNGVDAQALQSMIGHSDNGNCDTAVIWKYPKMTRV